MNRFLCEPGGLMLHNMTIYHVSQKLSDISIYILPILALVGNSLTLLVVLTNPQLNRSSFSVYVKSMAISDTLVLLLKFFSYQNKTSKDFYFSSLCTIFIFCGEASVLLSVWTIVAITVERAFVVLFPLHVRKFVSVYRARVSIMIIGILTILFSARVLIIPVDTAIEQNKRCHPITNWTTYRNINMTITEFGYCYIPLTIVIIGNLITILTVQRAVIQRHDLLTNNSYRQKCPSESQENQLTLMLLFVTIMFIVYFVPFTITNIISRWGLPFHMCFTSRTFEIYLVLRSLSEFLKDLNFTTNFIIYCISGRRFRYGFFSLFKCRHQRRQQSMITPRNSTSNKTRPNLLLKNNSERESSSSLSAKNTMKETQC